MNNYLITFLAFCCISTCYAQQYDFYPKNENDVSMSNFILANTILEETVTQVNERNGSYNYANLWNIGVAYQLLGKDAKVIKEILERSKKADPYYFSLTFVNPDNYYSKWKGTFSEKEYEQWHESALEIIRNNESIIINEELTDNNEERISHHYNKELIEVLTKIRHDDKLFRSSNNVDMYKQKALDEKNIEIIDSLYTLHKQYIGKSLVGNDLSSTMWAVIQHSNLAKMEEYLPVIENAINNGELNKTVIKLLVDRIHTIKFNTQIFGSQVGVPIANDSIVIEIRKKYGFNTSGNSKQNLKDWFKQKK
ncbi:hypothetical protein [Cellulophaga baltica]|uniref:Uncharacterized protein n=1 Tax=Cellulophaga baltica TaxID=76594 RepID=A0A1G7JMW4_9FLAO|nr:hypothetical protein [Cellulophaga baltica]SDF26277.1 hypothetical protein SAMN04487992_1109 [Cellulophaga baltica]